MPAPEMPSSIKFHYVKSNAFRVIHTTGAIGGLTPTREIFVALFNERAALPNIIELAVTPDGQLGSEIGRVGKDGLVREMDVGIVMSAAAAKNLADYLLSQVKLLNESVPETRNESTSAGKDQ